MKYAFGFRVTNKPDARYGNSIRIEFQSWILEDGVFKAEHPAKTINYDPEYSSQVNSWGNDSSEHGLVETQISLERYAIEDENADNLLVEIVYSYIMADDKMDILTGVLDIDMNRLSVETLTFSSELRDNYISPVDVVINDTVTILTTIDTENINENISVATTSKDIDFNYISTHSDLKELVWKSMKNHEYKTLKNMKERK